MLVDKHACLVDLANLAWANRHHQCAALGIELEESFYLEAKENQVLFGGRLGTYQYLDMHMAIRLTQSFVGKEDHDLGTAIMSELPGILNWALDGLDR